MFVIISHMHFAGAFSATEAYVASSKVEAISKCIDILKKHYDEYCEEEENEYDFDIISISKNDKSILMIDYEEAYTYKGGYGEVVTISRAN